MIIREDPELEEAVRDGIFDVAVPVSVFLPDDGDEVQITTFECTLDICREFEKKYGDDPFNEGGLAGLFASVASVMKEIGYVVDKKASRVILEYVANTDSVISHGDGAHLIFSKDDIAELKCFLLHKPEPEEDFPCAVVVCDDTVVSVAGINDLSLGDEVEIYTETAPGFRGKGYAVEAVSCLTKYLLAEGEIVGYFCGEDNTSSARVAEKSGFSLRGKRYSVVAYAENE